MYAGQPPALKKDFGIPRAFASSPRSGEGERAGAKIYAGKVGKGALRTAVASVATLAVVALPIGRPQPALGEDVITIIAMGQVGPKDCPLHTWFSAVPDIDYILVVTKQDVAAMSLEEMRRWIRIYLPRNREELVSKYDQYIFIDSWLTGWDSSIPLLTSKQVEDIKWSVGEGGMPIYATGIWGSETTMVKGILSSVMEEYYPVDLTGPRQMDSKYVYKVRLSKNPDLPPVLTAFLPLGIEKFQGQWVGQLYPKEGTTIWATLYDTNLPNAPEGGWPWLVSWKVGAKQTLFWVAADDMEVKWWYGFYNPPTQNPYGVDILCNIIYYSLGEPLPEDILMLHDLRRRFLEFNDRKAVSIGLIEFAERFKANTGPLWRDMEAANVLQKQANEAYLIHEFSESQEYISQGEEALVKVGQRALRLKDAALLWVYVIEWLAVTAVSMVAGSILWTLMIKRRLYREVAATRTKGFS